MFQCLADQHTIEGISVMCRQADEVERVCFGEGERLYASDASDFRNETVGSRGEWKLAELRFYRNLPR